MNDVNCSAQIQIQVYCETSLCISITQPLKVGTNKKKSPLPASFLSFLMLIFVCQTILRLESVYGYCCDGWQTDASF